MDDRVCRTTQMSQRAISVGLVGGSVKISSSLIGTTLKEHHRSANEQQKSIHPEQQQSVTASRGWCIKNGQRFSYDRPYGAWFQQCDAIPGFRSFAPSPRATIWPLRDLGLMLSINAFHRQKYITTHFLIAFTSSALTALAWLPKLFLMYVRIVARSSSVK